MGESSTSHAASEQSLLIESEDGVRLAAKLAVPSAARELVILAHAHPRFGGSMHQPVVATVARTLFEAGHAVLRFDFRGVGASEGRFSHGLRERADLRAVTAVVRARTGLPISWLGYSFGAWIAAHTLAAGSTERTPPELARCVLVAPPASVLAFPKLYHRVPETTVIAAGDDPFGGAGATQTLAARLSARHVTLAGADHFFGGEHRRAELARSVLAALGSATAASAIDAHGAAPEPPSSSLRT